MSSGVKVDTSVEEKYKRLKLKKEFGYLFLTISGDKVVVSKEGPKGASVDDFVNALSNHKDCCYAIYDGTKVGMFAWNPDTASAKSKVLLASTAEAVTSALEGVGQAINASDKDELKEKLKEKSIV